MISSITNRTYVYMKNPIPEKLYLQYTGNNITEDYEYVFWPPIEYTHYSILAYVMWVTIFRYKFKDRRIN